VTGGVSFSRPEFGPCRFGATTAPLVISTKLELSCRMRWHDLGD
jgi:hypothetical protein